VQLRIDGDHAAAGDGTGGAVNEGGRHQLRPDVLDRVGLGIRDPAPRGMLLEVLVRGGRAGVEGAQHGLAHGIVPERVQERHALGQREGDVEGDVLPCRVVPPQFVTGRRMTAVEDADEVVAVHPADQTQPRRRLPAPKPSRLAAGGVVVRGALGHRLLKVARAVADGHDVADADHPGV